MKTTKSKGGKKVGVASVKPKERVKEQPPVVEQPQPAPKKPEDVAIKQKPIDGKHSVYVDENGNPWIAKRTPKGELQPIPDNEPVILFRGRDRLAVAMLLHYRNLCVEDHCTDYQLQSTDEMIARFKKFAEESPTIKQPGVSMGN